MAPDILCNAHLRNSRSPKGQEICAFGGDVQRASARTPLCSLAGRMVAVVVLVGLGLAAQPARAEVPRRALQLLRQGKLRRAHRAVVDLMHARPDDPEVHAAYGAVLQVGGRDAEALVAFELGIGSKWYESTGITFHAKALAQVGRSEESTALRREFEVAGGRKPAASLGVRIAQTEDHIVAGRPWLAVEAGRQGVEQFPASPLAFAALTEAYLAAGELDEATWALLRAESLGAAGTASVRLARMRWHIAMEQFDEAWAISENLRGKRMNDVRFWTDRAHILRRTGDLGSCLTVVRLERFAWGSAAALRREASYCAEEAGDRALAIELMEPLADGYYTHPDHVRRLDELGIPHPE